MDETRFSELSISSTEADACKRLTELDVVFEKNLDLFARLVAVNRKVLKLEAELKELGGGDEACQEEELLKDYIAGMKHLRKYWCDKFEAHTSLHLGYFKKTEEIRREKIEEMQEGVADSPLEKKMMLRLTAIHRQWVHTPVVDHLNWSRLE